MDVVTVAVVVAVTVILGTNVLHLVDGAALGAALDRTVAGGGEPDDNVRVGGVTGAAKVLLVTEGLDGDGVLKRSCIDIAVSMVRMNRGVSSLSQIGKTAL